MPKSAAAANDTPDDHASGSAPQRQQAGFRAAFDRWSGRVRARLALRRVLTGAAVGLLVGAGGAAAAWHFRQGNLRPIAAVAGIAGAAVGFGVARRRRWRDADVAL